MEYLNSVGPRLTAITYISLPLWSHVYKSTTNYLSYYSVSLILELLRFIFTI